MTASVMFSHRCVRINNAIGNSFAGPHIPSYFFQSPGDLIRSDMPIDQDITPGFLLLQYEIHSCHRLSWEWDSICHDRRLLRKIRFGRIRHVLVDSS